MNTVLFHRLSCGCRVTEHMAEGVTVTWCEDGKRVAEGQPEVSGWACLKAYEEWDYRPRAGYTLDPADTMLAAVREREIQAAFDRAAEQESLNQSTAR